MAKPSWDQVDPAHNWIAQDADGAWWSYKRRPMAYDLAEVWGTEFGNRHISDNDPNPDWRSTLERRP